MLQPALWLSKETRQEINAQKEVRGDEAKVPCPKNVKATVLNVDPSGDAFQCGTAVGVAVGAGERTRYLNLVHQGRCSVGVRDVGNAGHFVRCVPCQCVQRSRNIGLSEKPCNVKFCLIDPFVPNPMTGHVHDAINALGTLFCGMFAQVVARFDNTKAHRGDEQGDEKGGLAGSAEHKTRWQF